ncbi:hypothetical protein C8Q80DRAFT_603164 [Daedaleopsis nitida]|nr:hypothetical protein C8Q80DRAFT_603164 [Daedaleopsis nitida]
MEFQHALLTCYNLLEPTAPSTDHRKLLRTAGISALRPSVTLEDGGYFTFPNYRFAHITPGDDRATHVRYGNITGRNRSNSNGQTRRNVCWGGCVSEPRTVDIIGRGRAVPSQAGYSERLERGTPDTTPTTARLRPWGSAQGRDGSRCEPPSRTSRW